MSSSGTSDLPQYPIPARQGATPGGIPGSLARRDFLKLGASATTALAFHPWQFAMAGPFTRPDFDKLVPADKKLSPDWVKSLTARGEREVYRGADLVKIGMPVGGICAGQLYLGGDGRLWHWDLFNNRIATAAEHYAKPLEPASPLDQGFALRIVSEGRVQERALDREHWSEVSFVGEYPIGYVEYKDPDSPVDVALEAFSPFIPLNTDDSSLPATVMQFTVKNRSSQEIEAELAGWLENAICLHSAELLEGVRRNRLVRDREFLFLECSAEGMPPGVRPDRPDIVFEDFEHEDYGDWQVTGDAFGAGPIEMSKIPAYQGDVHGKGKRVVNSHASAPDGSVPDKDAATGMLTSRPFTIERSYIAFLIGGGAHKGETCINLKVDGKVVLSSTGFNENAMRPVSWNVRRWAGKTARLEIVDAATGGWGNIGVDHIVFSDAPPGPVDPIERQPDFGTMGLALLNAQPADFGCTAVTEDRLPVGAFAAADAATLLVKKPFGHKLIGSLSRKLKLKPGESGTAVFVVSWHLPNLKMNRLPPGRYYATKFDSALSVARYVARNAARLSGETRLWHDTWYDGSLPWWLLDRTFLNTSILATSTCYRLGGGRFYGWEGVGCCEGTCGHVWQYAHAVARLFPDLERATREKVDFGLALQPDGAIHFRGEFNNIPAIDAQAGTILRALREHQMSPDSEFLKRNWPQIRKAVEWLIAKDENGDGLIEGNQHNTLDTDWYGPVAWLSGLYLAALSAAAQMATDTGDTAFADKCLAVLEQGQRNLVASLFDQEYFVNKPNPKHLDAINSGTGCHIDQVMGQSWAFQVGLPRVFPQKETLAALQSLWRYNFTPDIGPYRKVYKPGRWYAMPGEAGLLMCTFPRADWDYDKAKGKGAEWAAGYFNECMNGFEYQAAGHMLWEGMVTEGLAVTRAVHDRYHPSRRNPWNEVECGDHYARSMASYGVFLAACGFEYHGPKGHLAFAPRIRPGSFKAAFTAAEGWGTISQQAGPAGLSAQVEVKWGKLRLRSLSVNLMSAFAGSRVKVLANRQPIQTTESLAGNRLSIAFDGWVELHPNQKLELVVI
jgi:non-lysosomal glucosylceramidase